MKREYNIELASMEEAYILLQSDLTMYKQRLLALLEEREDNI